MNNRYLHFTKYQGAGNDFILIDAMESPVDLTVAQVRQLCDRRFGIGADGLIFIRPSEKADYDMVYHNADGDIGSMCGNGARCAYALARQRAYVGDSCDFIAYDGLHHARSLADGWVEVSMSDVDHLTKVSDLTKVSGDCILDTGSPHFVRFVSDLKDMDIIEEGKRIRYSEAYRKDGINVNFVEMHGDYLRLKTYERGVEDRTLACGTGATAVALAYAEREGLMEGPIALKADGGELAVNFKRSDNGFTQVVLQGPATAVFNGNIRLP